MADKSEGECSVSTRTASELLGVHESSVKRWCNQSALFCRLTPGGHRRIPMAELFAFARSRQMQLSLLAFDDEAERVWSASEVARRAGDFKELERTTLAWLQAGRESEVHSLFAYLRERGFGSADVFDSVLVPILRYVGKQYVTGKMSIGDEHRITHLVRDILIRDCPEKGSGERTPVQPTAVVGCGRGVSHELGALMVRCLLSDGGWRVIYLGADVPTEEFAIQQKKYDARLICVSLIPPVSASEASTVARLLDQVYSSDHPYSLSFGGSAVENDLPESVTSGQFNIPDIRFFDQLDSFSAWAEEKRNGYRPSDS